MTKPIPRRNQREALPFGARRWLLSGKRSTWLFLNNIHYDDSAAAFWAEYEDDVVRWWAARWPGFRPRLFWRFGNHQRLRIGGVGDRLSSCTAYAATYDYGIPSEGWRRKGDGFTRGVPVDPNDPPRFESQCNCLRRNGLLLPREKVRRVGVGAAINGGT